MVGESPFLIGAKLAQDASHSSSHSTHSCALPREVLGLKSCAFSGHLHPVFSRVCTYFFLDVSCLFCCACFSIGQEIATPWRRPCPPIKLSPKFLQIQFPFDPRTRGLVSPIPDEFFVPPTRYRSPAFELFSFLLSSRFPWPGPKGFFLFLIFFFRFPPVFLFEPERQA